MLSMSKLSMFRNFQLWCDSRHGYGVTLCSKVRDLSLKEFFRFGRPKPVKNITHPVPY
jgi:hypothetical protein